MKSLIDIIALHQKIITEKVARNIEQGIIKTMSEAELEAWHERRRSQRNKEIQDNVGIESLFQNLILHSNQEQVYAQTTEVIGKIKQISNLAENLFNQSKDKSSINSNYIKILNIVEK